jgi:hypothetical protein
MRWFLLALLLLAAPVWAQGSASPTAPPQAGYASGGTSYPPKVSGGAFSITAPSGGSATGNQAIPISTAVTYGSGCTYVLIGVNYNPPGTSVTIAAMTLNAAVATQVPGALAANTGNGVYTDMWVATPTGSSGILTITYSGALNNGNFAQVWCVVASTQSLTGAQNTSSVAATSISQSVAIPSGGGVVAMCGDASNVPTLGYTTMSTDTLATWTGQFTPVEGISAHSTSLTGTPTITCEDTTLTNNLPWALSLVAIHP